MTCFYWSLLKINKYFQSDQAGPSLPLSSASNKVLWSVGLNLSSVNAGLQIMNAICFGIRLGKEMHPMRLEILIYLTFFSTGRSLEYKNALLTWKQMSELSKWSIRVLVGNLKVNIFLFPDWTHLICVHWDQYYSIYRINIGVELCL